MHEEEGNRVLDFALLMNIVNVQRAKALDIDVAREHGELVDLRLVRAPVEAVLPARDEPLDVCEGHAVVPTGTFELVGEAGELELLLEQVEVGIGDVQRVGLF